MRCPACDADILEADPRFCPRCGAVLSTGEGEATTELDAAEVVAESEPPDTEVPEPSEGQTKRIDAPPTAQQERSDPVMADLIGNVKHGVRRQGWVQLLGAAMFIFLTMVATGAIMAIAAKLQYSFIGSGSAPLRVLSGLVITGLATLRIPVHIGDLTVSLLPLGALIFIGYAATWTTARVVRRGPAVGVRAQVLDGMKIAVPLALICWLAALVFRITEGPSPVRADAWGALLFGALWGVIFGALGGLIATRPLRAHLRDLFLRLRDEARVLYEGLVMGAIALGVVTALAVFAALIWAIVGLLEGRPLGDFGAGEAAAALLYLIAFGPNVIAAVMTLALGAPVDVGAQISSAGRMIGSLDEISVFGDNGTALALALLLVPAIGCAVAGAMARRNTTRRAEVVRILLIAAVLFAVVIFEVVGLADARLGAGLVRARGFAEVAPDAGVAALLAFSWAMLFGFFGWLGVDKTRGPRTRSASADDPPR